MTVDHAGFLFLLLFVFIGAWAAGRIDRKMDRIIELLERDRR